MPVPRLLFSPLGGAGPAPSHCRPTARAWSSSTNRRAATTPPTRARGRSTTPACGGRRRPGPASCRRWACRPASRARNFTASSRSTSSAASTRPERRHQRHPADLPAGQLGHLRAEQAPGRHRAGAAHHRRAGPGGAREPGLLRRARQPGQPGAGAGAEGRGGRAARLRQAQLRGRHLDHHRHARGAGPLRPRHRAGDRGGERPAGQEDRARPAGRPPRQRADAAGRAGGAADGRADRHRGLGRAGRGRRIRRSCRPGSASTSPGSKAQGGGRPPADARRAAGLQRHQQSAGHHDQHHHGGARVNAASIGVVFNMPLFAGFATENRVKETLALEEQSRPSWTRRAAASRRPPVPPTWAWCRGQAR